MVGRDESTQLWLVLYEILRGSPVKWSREEKHLREVSSSNTPGCKMDTISIIVTFPWETSKPK